MKKAILKKYEIKEVPCNGCTLCCRGDAIRLQEDDVPEEYETVPHPFVRDALMLAHKPNGECVYLTDTGCRIHERAPSLCRSADCRSIALKLDFGKARKLHLAGLLDFKVWDRGNSLLNELKEELFSKK